MNENGFPVSGLKCDQKYRNLEQGYKDFIQYSKITGKGKKKPPDFYDDMHALLSNKHSIRPVALIDTLVPSQRHEESKENKLPSGTGRYHAPSNEEVEHVAVGAKRNTKKRKAVIELIENLREENKVAQEELNKTLKKMMESMEKQHKEQQEHENKQLQETKKMHKEKMDVHKALVEALRKTYSPD